MKVLRIFFDLLTSRERRNLYLLFCAVVVMAGLEVISVGSIMPFLKVASDPSSVQENTYLKWAYDTLGFTSTSEFLVGLGLLALVALLASNAFIVLTTWALYRYAWGRNHTLSLRLLRRYLHRPYEYFLTRNTSEMGKNILEEVKEVVGKMLIPGLRGLAKGIVGLFIIGFLLFVDPIVASLVTLVLGTSYGVIYLTIKKRVDVYGEKRVEENTKRYRFVSEAFGGIKDVKLLGKENSFVNQYETPSEKYSKYKARYKILRVAPRYMLEAVAFGGIILIAVYLIGVEDNMRQVVPILGLYAFAGYRLMPALQSAFAGVASARFNLAALKKLHQDLEDYYDSDGRRRPSDTANSMADRSLEFQHSLLLNEICFTYPGADRPAVKNLTLEISAQTTVGFVGKTGSGKTTVVDLILGLLRPQRGEILVDDTPLDADNLQNWQRRIGYVPQQIYLTDDTIARNIAFGVPRDCINMKAVREAARRAHIYDFVVEELPNEWYTVVGERGVKLSGGQRQRIGIARALYHSPSFLVFDEATSALDQATEKSVMEAIYDLEGNHTLLIVAHRLSTVRRADNIVMLEDGVKVGQGTYEALKREHSKFRSMSLS